MTDQIAMFGLTSADPHVSWPERGSGETALQARKGWTRRRIPATSKGEPTTIDAMLYRELAVNVMLEGEGFAICLAHSGYRISYGGRVFARCEDAMRAAELMAASSSDWSICEVAPFNADQLDALRNIMRDAERRGEILIDRVFPT